jgi:hypothetical protein
MPDDHRKIGAVKTAIIWLSIGSVITAPVWLITSVYFLPLGWFGPLSLLAYNPTYNVLGKLFLVVLLSLPTMVGTVLIARRWHRLSRVKRVLFVILLSTLWHVPTTLLWIAILNSFN